MPGTSIQDDILFPCSRFPGVFPRYIVPVYYLVPGFAPCGAPIQNLKPGTAPNGPIRRYFVFIHYSSPRYPVPKSCHNQRAKRATVSSIVSAANICPSSVISIIWFMLIVCFSSFPFLVCHPDYRAANQPNYAYAHTDQCRRYLQSGPQRANGASYGVF